MRKVLVVEDEFLIRLTVIDALEDAGFEVIEAATADDALKIIEDHTIHLLFTDIQMPGRLTGVELAKVVAERFPEAGILVASGRMRPDELDLPRSAEFLSKPYDFSTVISRLKAMSTKG